MASNSRALGISCLGRRYLDRLVEELAPNREEAELADELFVTPFFCSAFERGRDPDQWSDQGHAGLVRDNVNIYRAELRKACDFYLNRLEWLHHPHVDWAVANALAFAEANATFLKLTPLLQVLALSSPLTAAGLAFLGFIAKWGFWGAVLLLTLHIHDGFGWTTFTWIALAGISKWRSHESRVKRQEAMASMSDVYQSLASSTLSWSVVWDLLAKSRDKGAYWDPELYRLVELRKQG